MSDSEIITAFELADLDTVFDIELSCHSHPWSKKVMGSCIGGRYLNYKLETNGTLIGFYIAEYLAGDATLMDICVLPKYQGQGYAKQLLQHLIEQVKTKGAEQCFLEVRQSNERAIAAYLNTGFSIIDKRKNYYPAADGREDAVIMQLVLNN